MRVTPMAFAGLLAAGVLAAPAAQAEWRGRGYHGYGYGGGAALGAILGLGAGVAIGTAIAPSGNSAPPSSFGGRQVFTPHVPPAPPYEWPPQGFGPNVRK